MIALQDEDFDILKIAESGQCFRMTRCAAGRWRVIAHGRAVEIEQTPDGALLHCTEEHYAQLWRTYFDLDTDYAFFRTAAPKSDVFLRQAAIYGRGIRILQQDPWEMLITFILSQRKSIPAIQSCVETLCERYGAPFTGTNQERFYAFPTPQALAAPDEAALRACALGYRAPYVQAAARLVASGVCDLAALSKLDDDALLAALQTIPGVGPKVASCVLLFGYHRLAAFPRDVWINRILDTEYGGVFSTERFPGFAGVMQQYIFYYARSKEYRLILAQKESAPAPAVKKKTS